MKDLPIIILTGLSGSGKSTAVAALEDVGYFCVDNMPVALLPKFLELPVESHSEIAGVALVMDLREKGFVSTYEGILAELRRKGFNVEIVFLEAEESVLIRRYSATRRQHPLARGRGLVAGIQEERQLLAPLRRVADRIVDTSLLNVHELKARIIEGVQTRKALAPMQVNILSFGFKFGVPNEADMLIDVRFLTNPYFVAELKPLDGEAPQVRDHVLGSPEAAAFLAKYLGLLDFLIPLYEREGKANLTIAVGCTGGRHRSVAIAGALYRKIAETRQRVQLIHRDIHQPQ